MQRKLIYRFTRGQAEGRAAWTSLLGSKGANLAEMANLGMPVPAGFTITTEALAATGTGGTEALEPLLEAELRASLSWLETQTGRRFGDPADPLLVSVRAGARVPMPGMLETVLDLGLNDRTVVGLARRSGDGAFAFDAYRRFVAMFAQVVLGVAPEPFEAAAARVRAEFTDGARPLQPRLLPESALRALVSEHKAEVEVRTRTAFPDEPFEQLRLAVLAARASWCSERARRYRALHGIADAWGTAVTVQAMVFGNLGERSGTAFASTRDPATGAPGLNGLWLPNAQGEDVVRAGPSAQPLGVSAAAPGASLEEWLPEAHAELVLLAGKLERHYRDPQELELTIEDGRLFLLQTRSARRSARAAVRVAVDLVGEGLLNEDEAILRIDPGSLSELAFPTVDPRCTEEPFARGVGAAPGAVSGVLALSAAEAVALAAAGQQPILVRSEASADDLPGLRVAGAVVIARGGTTSHAVVVARGLGRPCVVGCGTLALDEARGRLVVHGPDGAIALALERGARLTVDGASGRLFLGEVPISEATGVSELEQLLVWAERVRGVRVRANADTPEQARHAFTLGAQGIGLCRTEQLCSADPELTLVRQLLLARDGATRAAALAELGPLLTRSFVELFRAMPGHPVTIRLLDPSKHELLATDGAQLSDVAARLGLPLEQVHRRAAELREQNPMLGQRGVRLYVSHPEVADMQVRAVLEAAAELQLAGVTVRPQLLVPMVVAGAELQLVRARATAVAAEVGAKHGVTVEFQLGAMIELPRAALLADELARHVEFFSFGTNDLTQMTFGLSRDDAGALIGSYVAQHLLPADPFVSIDRRGVGELLRLGCEHGRRARPALELGVCGEHGADPSSIELFDALGMNYVSCSPYRVPIARLAVARAALRRIYQP